MKTIPYREFLRKPGSIFPLPPEGLEVVRQKDSFYIFPDIYVRQNTGEIIRKPKNLSDKNYKLIPMGEGKCMNCSQKKELFDVTIIFDFERLKRLLCLDCLTKARKEGVVVEN